MYKAELQCFERPEEVSVRHILTGVTGPRPRPTKFWSTQVESDLPRWQSRSRDPGSAKGGELGYFLGPHCAGVRAGRIRAAAGSQRVVKTQFGYHPEARRCRSAGKLPYAEAQNRCGASAEGLLAERRQPFSAYRRSQGQRDAIRLSQPPSTEDWLAQARPLSHQHDAALGKILRSLALRKP
jgi:hypothetical protein